MISPQSPGAWMAAERRKRDITQETMARAIGIAQSALSRFERGHRTTFTQEQLSSVADLLEIPFAEVQANLDLSEDLVLIDSDGQKWLLNPIPKNIAEALAALGILKKIP